MIAPELKQQFEAILQRVFVLKSVHRYSHEEVLDAMYEAYLLRDTQTQTITVNEVDIMKGVYLDFDNGPVVIFQAEADHVEFIATDFGYRGMSENLSTALSKNENIKYAKTFDGKKIVLPHPPKQ